MKGNKDKTKGQLIKELEKARQRIIELTESKIRHERTEVALQESKEKYKDLAESITDVFFAFDKDLRYTYWNKASEKLTGISAEDALGKHIYNLFPDSEMTRRAEKVYLKALRTQQVQSFVNEYQLGGKDYFFEISAYPSKNGLSVFTRDITERKEAEEREKELQQELYRSSRLASVGELAAGVAHQINNPLTGVLGFSQRLLRKSTDEEVSQGLRRIYTEAERAAKVVQNLLAFARRRQPNKQYSDINEILESALELRAYQLKTSNIEVITNLAPSLPKIMLDFHQIQEVFLNIILNAEQAMTEANNGGKLTIKTGENKRYVRTTFTDDGPGIPAEHLDKIFDPFFTTKGEKGGTGLGLSVCHGIITEHGGKIYAKSQPGKGATFIVEFPLTAKKKKKRVKL
ncbi:Sensor histidine kinase TmoS [subsurface metagenome]